jgi:hypothetical protein
VGRPVAAAGLSAAICAYEQAPAYEAPPPAPGDDMDAKIDQLKQLGELKTQGVLTEEEFEAQKRRILGS